MIWASAVEIRRSPAVEMRRPAVVEMLRPGKKLFFAALLLVASLNEGSCVDYVSLVGTTSSDPPMLCEEKAWTHVKPDGTQLDVELFSGEDGFLKIKEPSSKEEEEEDVTDSDMYSLTIKLTEDATRNNYLFLGDWKCKDKTWIVIGDPYISRLSVDWETEDKRPISLTINEGSDINLICEAMVVAKEGVTPLFDWLIEAEEGVTDGEDANYTRWSEEAGKPIEGEDNKWKSSFKLTAAGGATKSDRYRYRCSVKAENLEKSAAVLIRIKGRLAALWPSIGILIELLLLGFGTWLYERRRSKAAAAESDSSSAGLVQPSTSGGGGAAAAAAAEGGGGGGAVRKRNTVNT